MPWIVEKETQTAIQWSSSIFMSFHGAVIQNASKETTYIHTYNFICFSRLQKKAAYADVDLLKAKFI